MKYPYAIWRQFMVPQRLLTRFAGWVATRRWPWLKNYIIRSFCERYQVDMSEAANPDLTSYACFQDFFTRVLKVDARPIIHSSSVISSPCDGTISQIGKIDRGSIIQAKGHVFTVSHLLADDDSLAKQYDNGHFVTIYLAPRDYHRVHMPVKGTLSQTTYIPGKLFFG